MNPEPPTVDLGRPVTLVEPPSLFSFAVGRTEDQIDAQGFAGTLAYGAAALRACWPEKATWPVKVRLRMWAPGQDVARYGAEVWEALRSGTKGQVPFRTLRDAVIAALTYSVGCALTESEVAEAQGFSEGQQEG